MYRYLLTFSVLHDIPESIAIDVRYLLDPRKYVEFFEPRDIAIVPSSNFSDIESQRKILILIKRNELYSDYGVREFCSEITIAGYLYNCFKSNLQKNPEYYKIRDGFYDMFSILDEVSFARNKGLDIFNELDDAEVALSKNLSDIKAQNHGKYAAEPTVYIKFKTKIASLLKYYDDDIRGILVKMLNGNDLIRYCNNEYLFANNNIYQCYPIKDFNFTLKHLDDFYNDYFSDLFNSLSKDLNLLKNEFNGNYLLYLSKWMSKRVKNRKSDLFTSVNNLLDKFYKLSEVLCDRYDNFDTMFYWFNCLMIDINRIITDNFDNKECVFYYGDLKRNLVNNNIVQEKFYNICNKFSLSLLNNCYPKDKYKNLNEILKSFFFSTDTVLGIGQQDQKNEIHAISRLLVEIDYDMIADFASKECFFSGIFPFYSTSKHYIVDSRFGKGVLQILKDGKTHKYICDYIDQKRLAHDDHNFMKNVLDKIFHRNDVMDNYGDSYRVLSKRIILFYDSFYIYLVDNGTIKHKLYYKMIFPSIDIAVLTLVCHVFGVEKID